MTKRCCGVKALGIAAHDAEMAEFGRNVSKKDGLQEQCRRCRAEYRSAANRDRITTYRAVNPQPTHIPPATTTRPRKQPKRRDKLRLELFTHNNLDKDKV